MADALQILRAGGILMPETMIRAAQLEGVSLAVAATILMKETGGGKNIYGHDGVPTGNTYVKGAVVTRDNYLAYRGWMRGGSGRRQGVGPCQCTSAQYQDVADALGGCWDPLANMRSGFRGMGALIKAYGVQQGARRYNGSGPAAEKYGRDFAARHAPWAERLARAAVPNVTIPRPQEDDLPTPADVWQHPIDDPYTPKAGDTQPAHVVLAWLGANAAVARADAAEAKAAAERCEHKLDQLLARLG